MTSAGTGKTYASAFTLREEETKKDQFDVDELEQVLKEIFMNDIDILKNVSANVRSDIRRLIRIYDYLKWGKVKELSD